MCAHLGSQRSSPSWKKYFAFVPRFLYNVRCTADSVRLITYRGAGKGARRDLLAMGYGELSGDLAAIQPATLGNWIVGKRGVRGGLGSLPLGLVLRARVTGSAKYLVCLSVLVWQGRSRNEWGPGASGQPFLSKHHGRLLSKPVRW